MIEAFLSNPIFILPMLAAMIIAFTFHEFSHALVADLLGDPTPKALGRLTLNPLAHLHPLGFVLLIFTGFGFGKPVPFDPTRLKNPKLGSALIGLAGPGSNFLMAALALLALIALRSQGMPANTLLYLFLLFLIQFNIVLLIFNLIPIPPLDGSKALFAVIPDKYDYVRQQLSLYGPMILIFLVIVDRALPVSFLGSLFDFFLNGIQRFIQ